MTQPPYSYTQQNAVTSSIVPGTVHTKNTYIFNFYQKYLFQKLTSQFVWKLPDNWDENYFITCLYAWGNLAVFDAEEFGIVALSGSMSGYNLYYQPTRYIIANPIIGGKSLDIGGNCELIYLQHDYSGALDLVNYYADILATSAETLASNIMNSKLSYVFASSSKNAAETGRKMFDMIQQGQLAVWYDTQLLSANGKPIWQPFSANVKQNYIAPDILKNMQDAENEFCRRIGIPTVPQKAERLITAEAEKTTVETDSIISQWEDTLKKCFKRVSDMFGVNVEFSRRYPIINGGEANGYSISVTTPVQT